jgi:hypothetical protein
LGSAETAIGATGKSHLTLVPAAAPASARPKIDGVVKPSALAMTRVLVDINPAASLAVIRAWLGRGA